MRGWRTGFGGLAGRCGAGPGSVRPLTPPVGAFRILARPSVALWRLEYKFGIYDYSITKVRFPA